MIKLKEERLVFEKVEKLYLSHGESGKSYSLTTKYEDIEQYIAQLNDELYALDNDTDDFNVLKSEIDELNELLNGVKLIIMKYNPEYFEE